MKNLKSLLVLTIAMASSAAFAKTYNCGLLNKGVNYMGAPVYSVEIGSNGVTVVEHQNDTFPPQVRSYGLSKVFQGVDASAWQGHGFTVDWTNGIVSLSQGGAATMCSADNQLN